MGAVKCLGVANVMAAMSLLLIALSFSTDNWIIYTVDRATLKTLKTPGDAITTDPLYFSRNRGLFRTCFSGNETLFLEKRDDVIDKKCIKENGYELTQDPETINYGDDYELRKHLMRSHVATFILAMLLLFIGCIVGAVGCIKLNFKLLRASGLFIFFGAFFTAGGMAIFHGYEYLEKQKISQVSFYKIWSEIKPLGDYVDVQYGYSYMLAWIGLALSMISANFFLVSANMVINDEAKRKSKEKQDDDKYSKKEKSVYGMGQPVVYPYVGPQDYNNMNYATMDPYGTKATMNAYPEYYMGDGRY